MKTRSKLLWFLVGLIVLVLTCARERVKEPIVYGFLFKQLYYTYVLGYERSLEIYDVDGLPQVPTALLNGWEMPLIGFNPQDVVYDDTVAFPVDTVEDLKVSHYYGQAHSRIMMPGDFEVTVPQSWYVFGRHMPLPVNWRKSEGATWYWVDLYLEYEFNDSNGEWDLYEFDRDTFVSDTFCVYDSTRFFPGYVAQVLDGDGAVVIWASDGPKEDPGAMGNVEGDGIGYFSSANQAREADFIVVSPPATQMDRTALIKRSKARFLQRLRARSGIPSTVPDSIWHRPAP